MEKAWSSPSSKGSAGLWGRRWEATVVAVVPPTPTKTKTLRRCSSLHHRLLPHLPLLLLLRSPSAPASPARAQARRPAPQTQLRGASGQPGRPATPGTRGGAARRRRRRRRRQTGGGPGHLATTKLLSMVLTLPPVPARLGLPEGSFGGCCRRFAGCSPSRWL